MKYSLTLRHYLEITLFSVIGLIPRIILLRENGAGIESDEAIVGLMAKHMMEGASFPIFYYGQSYMGSLEAIFVYLSFCVFGISNLSVKIVPLFFSILLIGVHYYFGFLLKGRRGGQVAALLTALAPSPLIVWSLKARGGFIETVLIGSLLLVLSVLLIKNKSQKPQYRSVLYIGLLSGLGWWTNNQIIFYYPSVGLCVLLYLLRYKIAERARLITIALLGFIVGSGPFWYHNVTVKPYWSTFEVLFGKSAGDRKLEFLQGYFTTALPIILGARKFWAATDIYPGATISVYVFCLLILIYGIRKKNLQPIPEHLVLFIFTLVVPVIFSTSSFGWLSQAPRYLLPLYSVIPIIVSLCICADEREKAYSRYSHSSKGSRISLFLLAGMISINLCSNYLGGIADEGQPMLFKGQRVAKDHEPLYAWLKSKGYSHVYTNYWVGYRMAFETKEEITFSVFGYPETVRIPWYEDKYPTKNFSNKVFVLAPAEGREIALWIKSLGYCFDVHAIGEYLIIDNIKEKYIDGKKIDLIPSQFRSFIPPQNTNVAPTAINFQGMIDSDPKTRWGSGKAQTLGMAIEIDLDGTKNIQRIVMKLGDFIHDAPRFLNISGVLSDTNKRVEIFTGSGGKYAREAEFFDLLPDWDFRFKPLKLKMLRFELMDSAKTFDWSIAELEVYTSSDIPNGDQELCHN